MDARLQNCLHVAFPCMHCLLLLGEMLSALQPTAYLGQYVPRYLRYVARFRHLLRKTSLWRQEQSKVQS